MHTHIHYNYLIEVMRNLKKKNLEKYYRIKIDIYIYIERERERERKRERENMSFFFSLILKQNTYPKHPQSITSFTKPINLQRSTLTSKL